MSAKGKMEKCPYDWIYSKVKLNTKLNYLMNK